MEIQRSWIVFRLFLKSKIRRENKYQSLTKMNFMKSTNKK